MCGIVGIVAYNENGPVSTGELIAIRDHMMSRGPDAAGAWLSDDGRVGLGHRRLEIIGPGAQGMQPMALDYCYRSEADKLVVSFNGEIYNHRELRARLQDQGHVFKSSCDTEVLLHLYEAHGHRLVEHLRGMYAFGIWDAREQRLSLFRDPFGVKPLYYADDGKMIRFASQARALLHGGAVEATTDEGAVAGFFLFGNVPEPRTAWQSIKALPAGSTMTLDLMGAPSVRTYFSEIRELRAVASRSSEPELQLAIADSVRAHLVADVEVGAFLSAGIDSGAIVALASAIIKGIHAVTLGFEEFSGTDADETAVATVVAKRYGALHSVDVISRADCETSLPAFFAAMDQPSIDGLNTWLVSRAAHDAGLKVALSGLGGDELLGGYSTFKSVPSLWRRLRFAASVPGLGSVARAVLRAALPSSANPKFASLIEYSKSLEMSWLLKRSVFLPWELSTLLGADRAIAALEDLQLEAVLRRVTQPSTGSAVAQVAAMESGLYMRNQLLRDADWASMAHSVEVRVPLVDVQLFRSTGRGFDGWTPGGAKMALVSAAQPPLPPQVVNRTKTGFGLPMHSWIPENPDRSQWKRVPMLAEPRCPWSRRWAFVVAAEFGLVEPDE